MVLMVYWEESLSVTKQELLLKPLSWMGFGCALRCSIQHMAPSAGLWVLIHILGSCTEPRTGKGKGFCTAWGHFLGFSCYLRKQLFNESLFICLNRVRLNLGGDLTDLVFLCLCCVWRFPGVCRTWSSDFYNGFNRCWMKFHHWRIEEFRPFGA